MVKYISELPEGKSRQYNRSGKVDFQEFLQKIEQRYNLNLRGYKEKQLKRRIDAQMESLSLKDYREYLEVLERDQKELERFLDRVTINVSEFFRNPEIFDYLEKEIMPSLLQKRKKLRIWSAACSNGAEPYSLAIILKEADPLGEHYILATDMDSKILEEAKAGIYDQRSVRNLSQARLKKYFEVSGDKYIIKPEVKKTVNFKKHDLLKDPFEQGFDLIVCRNVLIYFTAEAQNVLYQKFWEALLPGGILFIGATETILNYKKYGYKKISSWFYAKENTVEGEKNVYLG